MTDDALPLLPPDPKVIELSALHAPRSCAACGEDASYYAFITGEMVKDRDGVEHTGTRWPVNYFLCAECFRDAPRTDDWASLEGVT